MGGTYSTHGRNKKLVQNFSRKTNWNSLFGRLWIIYEDSIKNKKKTEDVRVWTAFSSL